MDLSHLVCLFVGATLGLFFGCLMSMAAKADADAEKRRPTPYMAQPLSRN